jgi:hypothetical protein
MFLPGVAPLRSLVRLVSLLGLSLCLVGPALSQEVHLVVSSRAGDRLREKPSIHFQKSSSAPGLRIEIHDDVHYQTI